MRGVYATVRERERDCEREKEKGREGGDTSARHHCLWFSFTVSWSL